MADSQDIKNFEAFWPIYLAAHRNKISRALHFIGTLSVFPGIFIAVLITPWWWLAIPLIAYGLAWTGHFVFEGNTPATFSHPFWSLRADFKMFAYMLIGRPLV